MLPGRRHLAALALALAAVPSRAQTGTQPPLRLLSAGALEPGVAQLLQLWRAQGGAPVEHSFNTAPRIAERLAAGESFDVLFATTPVIEGLARAARLMAPSLPLGSVGVGIAIRQGEGTPPIPDEAALRMAVQQARAVVFNRASTGLYMERLFARLGLADAVAGKEVRFPDGDAVLRRIASGTGPALGFAAITEILQFRDKGVAYLGPLPAALQNRTAYAAALLADHDAARSFFAFTGGPAAKVAMQAAGID